MKLYSGGIFVLSVSLFLILSCSNASQNQNFSEDNENLKSVVLRMSQELQWTKELEKSRLSQKINPDEFESTKVLLSQSSIIAQEGGIPSSAVYPVIEGFTSLDISDTDPAIISIINKFFIAFSKSEECDSFMDKNSIYSLSLFLFDVKESGFSVKGLDWIIGRPFASDNAIEVPVRMQNRKLFIDVNFFMKPEEKSYKILDLEICKTGELKRPDGEGSDGK